jgi:hypothetical protein
MGHRYLLGGTVASTMTSARYKQPTWYVRFHAGDPFVLT